MKPDSENSDVKCEKYEKPDIKSEEVFEQKALGQEGSPLPKCSGS